MKDSETWKDITGFPYEVSSHGRVRNKRTNYILKPVPNTSGYYRVSLHVNTKNTDAYVQRLVATYFLDKPLGKDYVNHIDGDKSNNHVSNLAWVTASENTWHSIDNLGYRPYEKLSIPRFNPQLVWDIRYTDKYKGYTVKALAKLVGASMQATDSVRNFRSWKHITKDYFDKERT